MTSTISIGPLPSSYSGPLGGAGNGALIYDSGQLDGQVLAFSITLSASCTGPQDAAWDAVAHYQNLVGAEISQTILGTKHVNTDPSALLAATPPVGCTRILFTGQMALNSPNTGSLVLNGNYTIGATVESVSTGVGGLATSMLACCDKIDEILASVRRTFTSF